MCLTGVIDWRHEGLIVAVDGTVVPRRLDVLKRTCNWLEGGDEDENGGWNVNLSTELQTVSGELKFGISV